MSAPAAGQGTKIGNLDDRVTFKQQLEHNVGPDDLRVSLDRHRVAFCGEGPTFWHSCPVASRLREDMSTIILLIDEDVRLIQ